MHELIAPQDERSDGREALQVSRQEYVAFARATEPHAQPSCVVLFIATRPRQFGKGDGLFGIIGAELSEAARDAIDRLRTRQLLDSEMPREHPRDAFIEAPRRAV